MSDMDMDMASSISAAFLLVSRGMATQGQDDPLQAIADVRRTLNQLHALKRRRLGAAAAADTSSTRESDAGEQESRGESVAGSDGGFLPLSPSLYSIRGTSGSVQQHGSGRTTASVRDRPMNDYSQHFTDTGLRPQNYVRGGEVSERYVEYPKLEELRRVQDALIRQRAAPPMYLKCDLKTFDLTSLPVKFDVVLIDPPWEEYVRRQPSVEAEESWSVREIMDLQVGRIVSNPGFVFLWCGSAEGLQEGRRVLRHWGFRRCEDICWLKTNKEGGAGFIPDKTAVVHSTKEHCLLGIRGQVRRNTDGHLIHANTDIDVIVAEEVSGTAKPEEMYQIIEHFCLGMRRLELFGEDHNLRPGWLTLGRSLSASNYNAELYQSYFSKGTLTGTTPTIEQLRPRTPPRGGGRQSGTRYVRPSASAPRRRR